MVGADICGEDKSHRALPEEIDMEERRLGLCAPSSSTEAQKKRLRLDAAAPGGGLRPRHGCAVAEQRRRGGRREQRWPGAQSGEVQAPDIEVSLTWAPQKVFRD